MKGGKLERAEAIPYSDAHLEGVVRDYLAAHPFVSEEFAREKVLEMIKEEEKADKEIWQNDLVQVLVYRNASADEYVHEDSFKGKLTYLSIKRLDKKPINFSQYSTQGEDLGFSKTSPDPEKVQNFIRKGASLVLNDIIYLH